MLAILDRGGGEDKGRILRWLSLPEPGGGKGTRPERYLKAGNPVMCWPRISVWTSSVPS
jgi:hypothetical protein